MWTRLIHLLILVFFTKTFVKAGFALPGLSANPKNLELLKKDKSFHNLVKAKQGTYFFGKRKLKSRGLNAPVAEVQLFHFSNIKTGVFRSLFFPEYTAVLNRYLLPSRRGPPLS